MEHHEYVLEIAAKSPCENRKVGALVVSTDGCIIGEGFNHTIDGSPCEDKAGATEAHVIHAEVAAIQSFFQKYGHLEKAIPKVSAIYVTHNPCPQCLSYITRQLGKEVEIIVVDSFMKFDTHKLRYDLIPSSTTLALASVLTYGARKYKPNNWREVDDLNRYVAAAMRHFEAYRSGEDCDEESGMSHLWHALTNIAFLIELEGK